LNLEPEALAKARLLARQRGVPLGKVVSELVLEALKPRRRASLRNGVPVFPPGGGPAPDLEVVNRLRD
jgi:hypothetical protein